MKKSFGCWSWNVMLPCLIGCGGGDGSAALTAGTAGRASVETAGAASGVAGLGVGHGGEGGAQTAGSSGSGAGDVSPMGLIGETVPAGVIEMATQRDDLQPQISGLVNGVTDLTTYVSYGVAGTFLIRSQQTVRLTSAKTPAANLTFPAPALFAVGPDLEVSWSTSIFMGNGGGTSNIESAIMAPSGDTYFTGWAGDPTYTPSDSSPHNLLANEQYAGGRSDAVVGKLDSQGNVAWIHFFGTAADDRATQILFAADGSPVILGSSSSTETFNGPTIHGPRFAASFSVDGKLQGSSIESSTVQSSDPLVAEESWDTIIAAAADASSNIYQGVEGSNANIIQSFDEDGTLRFTTPRLQTVPSHIAVTPDGSHLYTVDGRGCTLTSYSTTDGSVLWSKGGHVTEIFTPDMTQYWLGSFESCDTMVATADTVYIGGSWTNFYTNQSTGAKTAPFGAPQGTHYVGAYDLDGNKKWFVQLTPINSQDDVRTDTSEQLFVDEQGNLRALFSVPEAGKSVPPMEVAHLNATDGTLLP